MAPTYFANRMLAEDVIPSHIRMSGFEMGLSAMPTKRESILSDTLSHVKPYYNFILNLKRSFSLAFS